MDARHAGVHASGLRRRHPQRPALRDVQGERSHDALPAHHRASLPAVGAERGAGRLLQEVPVQELRLLRLLRLQEL